jgi:selenide,water dikinase
MRCGGCGAKVSAEVLVGALASLPRSESIDLDDAAVLTPPPGKLLVQSVDHFRSFLDDPFVFGQIAAAHALSDLYAMGAEPWTALAIASVPYGSSRKMRDELSAMLRGATEILRADGCALVGGHSAEASETALGFSVTGLVDIGKVIRKAGLRPGDRLILTKPLGTGIILAGHMRGNARARWLLAAIASMRTTNAVACRIAIAHRPHAGTDVTGFLPCPAPWLSPHTGYRARWPPKTGAPWAICRKLLCWLTRKPPAACCLACRQTERRGA